MKARALYHLLEVRAWRLEPIVDAADRAWLEHVRSSLEVAAVDGQYRISWQTSDHRRSEGISQRAFEFYSRGDLATGAESKRAGRLDNWRAATQVWQRIFAVEERAWPEAADAQGMGIEGPAATLAETLGLPCSS